MSFKSFLYTTATTPIRYLSNLIDTPAVIFIYHRVTNLQIDTQQLAVSPDNFNEQVSYLKRNYNLVSAEEFLFLAQSKKKFPKHTALLTFDDGYADNYLEAIPILESNNAQAIFYITTSNLNTAKELWWDELERILLTDVQLPSSISINDDKKNLTPEREQTQATVPVPGLGVTYPTVTIEDRTATYFKLHPILKWTRPIERENILNQLQTQAQLTSSGRPSHCMMTHDELKKMTASKAAVIGAHTHAHAPMSLFNKSEQLQEMKKSKDFLEQLLKTKIEHASYPFGSKKDFNNDSIEVCKELNFKMTCANYYNQVHTWSNLQALPRVLVRDWNLKEFKEQLKKFYTC